MSAPKADTRRGRAGAAGFAVAVCLLSVWWMARTFQWREIGPALLRADPYLILIGAGGTTVAYWVLRAFRWQVLLAEAGCRVPFLDVYLCSVVLLSLSVFTPAKSGEALKVEVLRKYSGVRRVPGYGTFMVERVLDLLVVAAIAAIGVGVGISRRLGAGSSLFGLGVLLALCFAFMIVRKSKRSPLLGALVESMQACVRDRRTLVALIGVTCLCWCAVGLLWQCLLGSVTIHLAFPHVMALMAIATVAGVLSLVPGAVGVSEVAISSLLMDLGVAPATAQAGALVIRLSGVMAAGLGILHLLAWMAVRRPKALDPAGECPAGVEVDGRGSQAEAKGEDGSDTL